MNKSEQNPKTKLSTVARRRQIMKLLSYEGSVDSDNLASNYGVSHMTIWRDLKALEEEGKTRRVRGGAVIVDDNNSQEPLFARKKVIKQAEKERIALYAAEHFVTADDIIIVEAGTTVASIIKHLNQRNLTIITNGLAVTNEAALCLPDMTVLCCGGMLRDVGYTFVGPQAEQFFHNVRAKVLFLGASGLAFPGGITDPNPLEIQVKQAMAANAQQIVLLLDSSKFGIHSLFQVLTLDRVDAIVTDVAPPETYGDKLREAGVEIHIASAD